MKLLFLDFETYYADDFSLGGKKELKLTTQEYIRDPRFKVHGVSVCGLNGTPKWFTGAQCPALFAKIIPDATVVAHNCDFDCSILAWHYGIYPAHTIDTLALSRGLIGTALRSHGLDSVHKFLFGSGKAYGLEVSKGKRDLTASEEAILAGYCNQDVEMCRAIYKRLAPYYPREYLRVQEWVTRAYTHPRLILDTSMLRDYKEVVDNKKQEVLAAAGLENRDVLMSNDQFAEALRSYGLFDPLYESGLFSGAGEFDKTPDEILQLFPQETYVPYKVSEKTKRYTYAFAKSNPEFTALLEHDSIDVQALMAARLECKSTIEQTRAAKYLNASTLGPWPVDYNCSGAMQTHRLSGADGGGGNPQNLKRGGVLRNAVMAPDGYILVVGDLSQVEARITLMLAEEHEAIERFKDYDKGVGQDIYCWFGGKFYSRPITKKDNPVERQASKSGFLGCGFGAGGGGLQTYAAGLGVRLTLEEATGLSTLYRNTFPGVPKLWRLSERALNYALAGEVQTIGRGNKFTTGHDPVLKQPGIMLPSLLWVKYPGLRYDQEAGQWFYGSNTTIWGGKVVENIVQGVAGYILQQQLLVLDKVFPVVMQTHDELIWCVPEDKADTCKKVMHAVMTKSPAWWPELPLGAEVTIAKRYGEAK